MIQSLSLYKSRQFNKALPALLITVYLLFFIIALRTYIVWQSVNLILGLLSLPFISTIDPNKRSKRFAVVAMITIALACLVPVKTMLFMSILFAVLFIIENCFGSINILPVLACLLISPFFQYAVSAFCFSIRIMLSSLAGKLLCFFGDAVKVSGNMIESGGKDFAVDPACMGLNMTITSVLLGIILIGILQKKYQKVIRLWPVIGLLIIIFSFNIISNLLRIILLVRFSIMPEESMHEITGVLCLLMYVGIPSILLVKWAVKRFGKAAYPDSNPIINPTSHFALHLLILFSVILMSFKIENKEQAAILIPKDIASLKGFKIENINDNIIKMQSPAALIYIKPITTFYESEHNPSICWKGSGYEMKKISAGNIQRVNMNTAILEKEQSILYTAWWFDNGEEQTTSQLDWRWKMFKGSKPFSVINITAATEEELEKQVSYFLNTHINKRILLSKN